MNVTIELSKATLLSIYINYRTYNYTIKVQIKKKGTTKVSFHGNLLVLIFFPLETLVLIINKKKTAETESYILHSQEYIYF